MSETMKAIVVKDGEPLHLADVPRPEVGPHDVLVKVAAAGLNRADLVQRAGHYPPPPGASEIMGLECSGTVAATGEKVTRWSEGDRVCALLAGGGYAQFCAVDEGSLLPVPENLTLLQAAALPEAMMTVYANIFMRCAFKQGETVLIHGGTSGIGSMAIQMVKQAGASEIWTTAGSADKCKAAETLGATRAINYKEEDFEEVVKSGGGADVILDMVGGPYVQKNINCANQDARIVSIAFLQGSRVEVDLMRMMLKRIVLTGSTLRARPAEEKARLARAVCSTVWPWVAAGRLSPVIDSRFALDDVRSAHARLDSGAHAGKILLTC